MAKSKKELSKKYKKFAKKSDWDTLAGAIIDLELKIQKTEGKRKINLLKFELEIYEMEKASRLFDVFDMEYFVNRDFEYFEDDPFDF